MYQCMCVYNDCTIDILMNNYTITIIITCKTSIPVYGGHHIMDTQILFNIYWNQMQIRIYLIM